MSVQILKEEVSKLEKKELFILLRFILDKVEESSDDISEEWKQKIEIRDKAYKNGQEKLHSWKDIKQNDSLYYKALNSYKKNTSSPTEITFDIK